MSKSQLKETRNKLIIRMAAPSTTTEERHRLRRQLEAINKQLRM